MADSMDGEEEIVMTPCKSGRTTTIKIAKVRKNAIDKTQVQHEAGGQHKGLVIAKQTDNADDSPPQLQLEFKCFLVDKKSGSHIPESRILKFWFAPNTDYLDKVTGAYEFFKELVKPDNFPRDYVGFIKKIMKQLQHSTYKNIKKVDVDLMQLDQNDAPPSPGLGTKEDNRPKEVVVQESLLQTLECAYPNILPVDDLAKLTENDENTVTQQLALLKGRDLIKEIEPGKFVRQVLDDKTEVKIVKQMPLQSGDGKRPTIAIITSKYYEKLAVDAMMENKTTFMRYKTEGESNVYTIGYIGDHKCVSTKLPLIGRARAAQISSGNTTTRLLGTFGDVEHVLLVGVAGGMPHYTDFHKHARLGDVIVSTPNERGFQYIFCENIQEKEEGQLSYILKSWSPQDPIIQKTTEGIVSNFKANPMECSWEQYMKEGQNLLQGQEVKFGRPAASTDRLFMNIGEKDVIEVGHPKVPSEVQHWYRDGMSVVRFGSIGAGKPILKEDSLRNDFAARHNCVCFDTEFDQVLESIVGNRKESFTFIRGVADYMDGTKNAEWQPYSALAAASFMKTLILNLPGPGYSS